MISDEATEDWVATSHDRVFYRSKADEWNRGEHALAKFIADHIHGWNVVITMGPYRGYDFRHEIHPEERLIHIDCYSVAMRVYHPQHPFRTQHSVEQHAESLLEDITQLVRDSEAESDLADS